MWLPWSDWKLIKLYLTKEAYVQKDDWSLGDLDLNCSEFNRISMNILNTSAIDFNHDNIYYTSGIQQKTLNQFLCAD